MKKMLVVAVVAMFAFAACGKKKDAAAPTGGTTEPAGSGSAEATPTPDGAGSGSAEAAPATP